MKKRYLKACMMVFAVILSLLIIYSPTYAISQSDVQGKLQSYMNQYVGRTATSGQMYMGSQCKGFANWIFKQIFGVYIGPYPESANYKITNPNAATIGILEPGGLNESSARELLKKGAPGDYIQVQRSTARGRGPHSMILVSVNDNGIEVFDCNSDGKNTIKRYTISYHDFDVSNRAMSLYRAYGYSPSAQQGVPSNPRISKNQYWYDLKDQIEITAHADGATGYYMSMFKDDKLIYGQGVDGGKFSFNASAHGIGHYTAHFACCNDAGSVDSGWIDFSVVGPAGYSDIRTSNWWYDLTDTVSISVDTVCAKYQFIGIDKEGVGRVVTENSGSTYNIAASRLGAGSYSAYFSVANGSGSVDTRRVNFKIVDRPEPGAVVSSSRNSYTLSDEVEVSVLVYCSKSQWIGIDRNGVERAITAQTFDGKYKIPASKLGRGKYSAYFTVMNNSGNYDTSRVSFAIDNPLTNPAISMDKTQYGKNENIKILASANGGVNYYTAEIYDSKGKEIIHKDFTGHTFSLNSSELGEGRYTAQVLCNNYAFHVATKRIEFTVDYGKNNPSNPTVSPGKQEQPPANDDAQEIVPPSQEESSGDDFDEEPDEGEEAVGKPENPSPSDEDSDSDIDDEETDGEDSHALHVGDVVEDAKTGDEYEIIFMDGSTIYVEYMESANSKAAVIKIPATIKIEDGTVCRVTSISKCAFKNNRRIKKVVIGSNVTAIGTKAFSGCKSLSAVTMGKNIVTVGANAFSNCTKLTSLTIPAKVTKIGANTFSGCKKLKKLDIKSRRLNAKGLNKKAFRGIPEKTLIRVPKDKRNAYKSLLCQRGLSKKNIIK